MGFEAQIVNFSSGLILLASYTILFHSQEYACFLLFGGVMSLLLFAHKDYTIRQSMGGHTILATIFAIIFLIYPLNLHYVPLIVVLLACLVSLRVKLLVFLPSLLGLIWVLFLQYVNLDLFCRMLGSFSAGLVSLLGLRSSMDGSGYVHTNFSGMSLPVLVDEIKLLLPFYLSILIEHTALLCILDIRKEKTLAQIFISGLLTFLMPTITFMYIIKSPSIALFIPDTWLFLLFPLAHIFLLSTVIPDDNIIIKKSLPKFFSYVKRNLLAKIGRLQKFTNNSTETVKIATGTLLIFFVSLSLLYYVPLVARDNPLVIIDESHSEWEPTWGEYLETYQKDRTSAINNYFGLLNLLSSIYDCTLIVDRPEKRTTIDSVKTHLTEEITVQTLNNVTEGRKGILILKCVTRAYSKSEIDAILTFVARGNGLILIGDHTDLWGMGTYLNSITEHLGYRFLPSAIFGSQGMVVTHKNEFPIFISRFLTGDYYWATSCSLERLSSFNFPLFEIRSHISSFENWRNETAPYFLTRNISEVATLNNHFHSHIILSAVQYGKGKAILMTDSTPFNNEFIGFGDHAQLFIAMVEYAASEEKINKSLILFSMIVTALLVISLNIRKTMMTVVILMTFLLVTSSIATLVTSYTLQLPQPTTEPKAAAVVMPKQYHRDYFSRELNLTEIMDKHFRQNLTAILFPGQPPNEWLHICAQTEIYEND